MHGFDDYLTNQDRWMGLTDDDQDDPEDTPDEDDEE
jgi:hypothetical protein